MDAASAAASSLKTVKALTISTTQKISYPTALIPPWLSTKPNILTLYASNSSTRKSVLRLTRCSTKPDTNTDNETDQNPTIEPDSNSKTLKHSSPISNESLSSLSPLSSSASSSSSSRGLVFGLGPANSWDSAEIGSPVVKRFLSDEEERWYMWYYGRSNGNPASDSIGLAVSRNGIHWERGGGAIGSSGEAGSVMNCSKDWWAFDTENIRPCEVVVMSSTKVRTSSAVYWLYYTGYSSEKAEFSHNTLKFNLKNPERFCIGENDGVEKISKSLPGLAISQDGRHWARIEGEHHSGALFDVGSEREWDNSFIAAPQVVFHGSGDLRMYYHSFDLENGEFGIGIARSRDGIRWVKMGKIMGGGGSGSFDELGVMNARVVRNRKDGKYVMAYEGVAGDGGRSIGLAVSSTGLRDWRRLQDETAALMASLEDGWDNEGVGSPCLVQMDGDVDEWRLYYRGVGNAGRIGIGMAVSQGSDITSFRRWTGFHL